MRVSVLHWNRPVECVATVRLLRASGLPLAITVIDNHSTDGALRELAAALPPEVELVKLPANIGWGPAHNVVLRRWLQDEHSEFSIVCAHDALPQGDCLGQVVRALESHPSWGMACPEYGTPEVPVYAGVRGARLVPVARRPAGTCEEVDYCHGTLAVFRRQCLQEIGLFDERYFAYGDETEIGIRARRSGWKVGLVWGAVVVNPGSWSGSSAIGYLWTRNSLRLARSHGGVLSLLLRLGYVAAVTCALRLTQAPANSLSSPAARWAAIRDYLRGYCGSPPAAIAAPNVSR
jgi:N-acetylglucosaminyl-diphospho-decaprenol L-rhamnosyltransferase